MSWYDGNKERFVRVFRPNALGHLRTLPNQPPVSGSGIPARILRGILEDSISVNIVGYLFLWFRIKRYSNVFNMMRRILKNENWYDEGIINYL